MPMMRTVIGSSRTRASGADPLSAAAASPRTTFTRSQTLQESTPKKSVRTLLSLSSLSYLLLFNSSFMLAINFGRVVFVLNKIFLILIIFFSRWTRTRRCRPFKSPITKTQLSRYLFVSKLNFFKFLLFLKLICIQLFDFVFQESYFFRIYLISTRSNLIIVYLLHEEGRRP